MVRRYPHRELGYRDAVRLLGHDEPTIVKVIDRLGGVAITSASVATLGALAFFDVRDELVSWGGGVVRTIRDRITGANRLDRTERLVAAHTVVVITSFYEALGDVLDDRDGLVKLSDLELTGEERLVVLTDKDHGSRYRQMVDVLLLASVDMPKPQLPYEETLRWLDRYYRRACDRLMVFIEGLACWEALSETGRERLARRLRDVHEAAVRRYEQHYRQLAAEVTEFGVWANLTDHQATRAAINVIGANLRDRLDGLVTGLAGIPEIMTHVSGQATANRIRTDLAHRYRAAIEASILSGASAPDGVALPSLEVAYVNPRCRLSEIHDGARPAVESWWDDAGSIVDLQQVIVGLLTAPRAVVAPLVVLGQPGSGKSVLMRMLAARLVDSDFLPVRVELRAVPADASIQMQIEHAIRDTTGRKIPWPDLAASAEDGLPVVLLDGFDELLQATGINRSDYLEQVAEFQCREYELGRPVAVIVTSRTVVADRARFPEGSVALKLEPFNEAQVAAWLEVWNEVNAAEFPERRVRPFPLEAALAHRPLASQPLLLMMLALYDASDNALQRAEAELSRAELYERLLTDFAHREVRKHHPAWTELMNDRKSNWNCVGSQ